jgi:hypothetical protein
MQNVYPDFTWWQGVVEDRNDPAKLGRVRVRILGYHTDDKTVLPTSHLPLAVLMQSPTSAGMSGIGQSATGLLEGSHVMGYFADGTDGQIPVIMGSLASLSMQPPAEDTGFSDPNKKYPLSDNSSGRNTVPESDQPRLSREDVAEKHYSLATKRAMRIKDVPIAFAPDVEGTNVKGRKTESFWTEPHPQGSDTTKTKYPYNHVHETESGHVFEIDDTPGAERIHNFHKSGTFEEIQPDGTKVTKVIGDDYDIVVKDRNVFIKGNLNITVQGDATFNVQGDRYEDITGDSYTSIRGSRYVKVQGNDILEVLSDQSTNITGSRGTIVHCQGSVTPGSDNETIKGRKDVTVGRNYNMQVGLKIIQSALLGYRITSEFGNYNVFTFRDINLGAGALGAVSIAGLSFNVGVSGATTINTGGILTMNTIGAMFVNSAAATYAHGAVLVGTTTYAITSTGNFSVVAPVITLN